MIRRARAAGRRSPTEEDAMGRAGDIWDFLKTRKKWWLTPVIIVLILLSVVLVLSQGSAVAPFIYAIF